MSRCFTRTGAALLPFAALLVLTSPAPAQAVFAASWTGSPALLQQVQYQGGSQPYSAQPGYGQPGYAQPGYAQPGYAQPAAPSPSIGAASETVSDLLTRVTSLEEEVRQLRGRVDELENALQHTSADLGKQIDDLRFQLQNQPAGSGTAASRAAGLATPAAAATAPPPAAAPTAAPGPRTPEVALQEGYAAMARRDYGAAERDAQEVLSKRASPRAYDAQYLLAQSLAGQHQWSRAAVAYDDAYNRSPKGGHAQEALLGLAISLTAISEKRAACDTLTKLHTEFPHGRPELHDQIAGVAQRAGCRG